MMCDLDKKPKSSEPCFDGCHSLACRVRHGTASNQAKSTATPCRGHESKEEAHTAYQLFKSFEMYVAMPFLSFVAETSSSAAFPLSWQV